MKLKMRESTWKRQIQRNKKTGMERKRKEKRDGEEGGEIVKRKDSKKKEVRDQMEMVEDKKIGGMERTRDWKKKKVKRKKPKR